MTSGTDSTRTQSQSLTPLAQLLSLCQRYQLPLTLLAIHLKDLAPLGREPGGERLRRLQQQLAEAVEQRVRLEDALMVWQRGYLVLCLPGTPVEGAVGLGRRLQEWFRQTRFTLDDRALQLTTAMAVHTAKDDDPRHREPIRELLMDTLCLLAADENGEAPILSRRAQARLKGDEPTPTRDAAKTADNPVAGKDDPPRQFRQLVDTLSRHGEGILVRALSPALRRLDEPTRLRLIDDLLEASLMPGAP